MCFQLQERQERDVLRNYDDLAQTETLHVMLLFTDTVYRLHCLSFYPPTRGKNNPVKCQCPDRQIPVSCFIKAHPLYNCL